MATLAVIEKYPDSYRIDHPHFGDVAKTTFAKGVITDFQKLFDDPFIVQSLVKVDLQGVGVSDFIPLFYHPKAKYWDPNSQTIGDIYFEKAWMSFRAGDEVVVMLKEGVPVAVLAFANEPPRVGEDVIKSAFKGGHWWRASLAAAYAGKDTGPDGMALKLLAKCDRMTAASATTRREAPLFVNSIDTYGIIDVDEVRAWIADQYDINPGRLVGHTQYITFHQHTTTTTKAIVLNALINVYYYLVVVGPILYLIAQESTSFKYSWDTIVAESDNYLGNPGFSTIIDKTAIGYPGSPTGYVPPQTYPENVAKAQAWRDWVTKHNVWNNPDAPPLPKDAFINEINVYAALYTKELYEKAKGASQIPSEFVEQLGFEAIMQSDLATDLNGADQPDLQFFVKRGANNG